MLCANLLLDPEDMLKSKNKYGQYQFRTKGHQAEKPGKS